MVETGKRVICSNVPVRTGPDGKFVDAHDFHAHLRAHGTGSGAWQDVPLSAAGHASARFPLVSPPGRLPSGVRVVDGGYFENSGATTGIDLLNAVLEQRDKVAPTRPLIFVFLRYAQSPGLTDIPKTEGAGPAALPAGDPSAVVDRNALNESTSIFGTLLNTRSARGSYAQDAVYNRYLAPRNAVILSFTFRGEKIPLSWSLSQRSCDDMLKQFPVQELKTPSATRKPSTHPDPATAKIIDSNLATADWLLRALYPPSP
jgi:hypothetical protein